MVFGMSFGRESLWRLSHNAAVLMASLLFTAGFLCNLLWVNNIVEVDTGAANAFNSLSPAVSTFRISYDVAIFGAAWNSVLFVTLLVLQRDIKFLSTERMRYEVEKAASIVGVVGNAIYGAACIAVMAVLARLASDRHGAQRAGQGATAAMAAFAGATAWWASVMDVLHSLHSHHRRNVKEDVVSVPEQKSLREGESAA